MKYSAHVVAVELAEGLQIGEVSDEFPVQITLQAGDLRFNVVQTLAVRDMVQVGDKARIEMEFFRRDTGAPPPDPADREAS